MNCSWMFSQKGDLRRHLTSCEEQTCASCRVRTANRKSLEKHCRMLNHQLPTSLQSSGTFSLDVKKNSAPLDAKMKKKDSLKKEKSLKKFSKTKKKSLFSPNKHLQATMPPSSALSSQSLPSTLSCLCCQPSALTRPVTTQNMSPSKSQPPPLYNILTQPLSLISTAKSTILSIITI